MLWPSTDPGTTGIVIGQWPREIVPAEPVLRSAYGFTGGVNPPILRAFSREPGLNQSVSIGHAASKVF